MPPASLFQKDNVSTVWLEVVDRIEAFLRSVICSTDTSGSSGDADATQSFQSNTSAFSTISIPRLDRHAALSLLLEFSIQKGQYFITNSAHLVNKISYPC